MTMFAPLEIGAQKRSAIYHAPKLEMLHKRVVKRMDKVDHLADEVERAASALVEVTKGSAVEAFRGAVFSRSSAAFFHMDAGQPLGM